MESEFLNTLLNRIEIIWPHITQRISSSLLTHLLKCASLMAAALLCICVGSYASLSNRSGHEKLSSSDALQMPVVASLSLFGLYLCFKFFKEYLNMFLSVYFFIGGVTSFYSCVRPHIKRVFCYFNQYEEQMTKWHLHIPRFLSEAADFNVIDIWAIIVSLAVLTWYILTKHWILNNLLGICFSMSLISLISLGQFRVGCIMLAGLFVYDIFWVFGTDVMVTVAKSIDAPIKLLFPTNIWASKYEFAMLGLGDIIIPGWFLAFLLRYDIHHQVKKVKATPYFRNGCIAYALGLGLSMLMMHWFESAQPALLYLVPMCILSSLITSFVLSDYSSLMAYREGNPGEDTREQIKVHSQ